MRTRGKLFYDGFTNGVGVLTNGVLGTARNSRVADWWGTQLGSGGQQQAITVHTTTDQRLVAIPFYVARSPGVGLSYPTGVVIDTRSTAAIRTPAIEGVMWIRVALDPPIRVASGTPLTVQIDVRTQWLLIGELRIFQRAVAAG